VRIFEVFGEIFVLVAMVMVVLAVIFQKRPIHTAVIYLHGAAGILINAYIFSHNKNHHQEHKLFKQNVYS